MPPKQSPKTAESNMIEKVPLSGDELEKNRVSMLEMGDGKVGAAINHMIQSRFPILYIRTYEEKRVVEFFKCMSIYRGLDLFHWDCDRGLLNGQSKEKITCDDSEVNAGNPTAVLSYIVDHAAKQSVLLQKKKRPTGSLYLLLDFHLFLDEDRGVVPQVPRKFKEFAQTVSVSTIIIIAPTFNCPASLEKEVTLIDFPSPSYDEIKNSLAKMAFEIAGKLPGAAKEAKENEEDLVKAVSGLTLTEAENAYAMTIVCDKKFNIQTILSEKKQMIRKGGILEYRDSRFSMDDVGGLDNLKEWLLLRRLAFREDARQFGLPVPKGVLLLGIPGTGKSMICDALASVYEMPLLRLDFGAVFSAHVGDSENNIRQCLKTAEDVAPCVHGDTSIKINNSSKTIKQAFEDVVQNSKNEVSVFSGKDGHEIQTIVYTSPGCRLKIEGIVEEKIRDVRVKAIIRTKKKEKMIKIRTALGKEIIVTQDHLLMDNERKMRKAKDFCVGDSISTVDNNNMQGDIDTNVLDNKESEM